MAKKTVLIGSVLFVCAIAVGAFGAHAWKPILLKYNTLAVFEKASDYHFYQSLGLLVLGLLWQINPKLKYKAVILTMMTVGTLLFSASLYFLALLNLSWLGMITPIGGVMMILAWSGLIFSLLLTEKELLE